jgi:hypothetical protein
MNRIRRLQVLFAAIATLGVMVLSTGQANAGYGGQTLYSSKHGANSVAVIQTCIHPTGVASCGAGAVNVVTWWTSGNYNCTHSYPSNDYFKNDVPSFNLVRHLNSLNCNYMVAYPGAAQQGGGALAFTVLAGNTAVLTKTTYRSISLHY